jgi:hypothetical protein
MREVFLQPLNGSLANALSPHSGYIFFDLFDLVNYLRSSGLHGFFQSLFYR